MPTTTKTAAKSNKHASARKPAAKSRPHAPDAVDQLIADHKGVKALFKDYEQLVESEAQAEDRQTIALQICAMLTAHATVEEELFYPAARSVLSEDEDLVDEADVEHASCKELIAQIEEGSPNEPLYDAKVKVLGEYIDHHVKEEEGEMFPKVRKSDLDLDALGEDMAARKAELLGDDADRH